MAKKEWKALLDKANENLQKYDVQLVIDGCDENGYSLDIKWTGRLVMAEEYACGYYEHELADLINEAWAHVLAKVNDPNLAKPVAVPMEKPKVWLVKQESNVDGQMLFNVVPCKDRDTAILELKREVNTLLHESPKYKDALRYLSDDPNQELTDEDWDNCLYTWEDENDDAFYIKVVNDDYHELLTIEEKEII